MFEARGEILTVPAEKGDVRNLTNTPGAADRDPAWSPDGKSVAYFSDESGEYELHIRAAGRPRRGQEDSSSATASSFFYNPSGRRTARRSPTRDKRLNLWYIDLDTGKSTKVDTGPLRRRPARPPVWSPDGKWLAYPRQLKNYLNAVFLYSLETGKAHQITDGMSDARPSRSTRAASTSTSPPAPTSARSSARACRSSTGR